MGTLAMGLFSMAVSREENDKTKIIYRKDMHSKYVILNPIKYSLFFNVYILNTEIFKCVSGAVNSIFSLVLWRNNLHCQIWFLNSTKLKFVF